MTSRAVIYSVGKRCNSVELLKNNIDDARINWTPVVDYLRAL